MTSRIALDVGWRSRGHPGAQSAVVAAATHAAQKLVQFDAPGDYSPALPLTVYNTATPVEIEATRQLIEVPQSRPSGKRTRLRRGNLTSIL